MVPLDSDQAQGARDAISKAVYSNMFSWLVSIVNKNLSAKTAVSGFIGILDIFGFEIFEVNSFEQLCINFANEKLQSLFNHHIFVAEQEQYKAEGVDMSEVKFKNNKPCVDLIESKPYGLLTMLDEVCRLNQIKDDVKLLDKFDKEHMGKNDYYVQKRPRRKPTFGVAHFAGAVTYHIDAFIEKNHDTLYPDLVFLMRNSSVDFMREICPKDEDSGGSSSSPKGRRKPRGRASSGGKKKKKASSTIAGKFKSQLHELNKTLLETTPHYVRCVKPNKNKGVHDFDTEMVLQQLLYAGVLETVRIRRLGYPFRETYIDFWRRCCAAGFNRFIDAAKGFTPAPEPAFDEGGVDRSLTDAIMRDAKAGSQAVCGALLDAKMWTTGRTKIFMKSGALDVLQTRLRNINAAILQNWTRGVFTKWHFTRYRRALVNVQKRFRLKLMKKKFAAAEKQVTVLQAHARRRRAQRRVAAMRKARANAGSTVLKAMKGNAQRRRYMRGRKGAVAVQARFRGKRERKHFVAQKAAATKMQALFRGHNARKRLRLESSVVSIQRVYRGHRGRKKAARRKEVLVTGIVIIQTVYRCFRQAKRFRRLRRGALTAQRLWRGRLAREEATTRRQAVVKLQSRMRAYHDRQVFKKARAEAVHIQAVYRGHRVRRKQKQRRDAVHTLERSMLQSVISTKVSAGTVCLCESTLTLL